MAEPDVEAFVQQVDEVSRLIEGLKAGTLSPDYVDTKIQARQPKPAPQPAAQPPDTQQRDAGRVGGPEGEHRRAELQRKAQELKAEYERRLRARKKYEEHVASGGERQQAFATDYAKWELWCPEDETDELVSSLASANPALKALERDIDERHQRWAGWGCWAAGAGRRTETAGDAGGALCLAASNPRLPSGGSLDATICCSSSATARPLITTTIWPPGCRMVEQRQLAERQRVRGNEAFRACNYSEALRQYEQGLDAQRHSMALHANAAMAALKMRCFVQAMEHCDKVGRLGGWASCWRRCSWWRCCWLLAPD